MIIKCFLMFSYKKFANLQIQPTAKAVADLGRQATKSLIKTTSANVASVSHPKAECLLTTPIGLSTIQGTPAITTAVQIPTTHKKIHKLFMSFLLKNA